MFVKVLSTLLGVWLFASAFLWPHTRTQFHGAWVTGVLVILVSVAVIAGMTRGRLVNFALALWLFLSTMLASQVRLGTAVNHLLVAAALIITSLFPPRTRVAGARRSLTPA